MLDWLFRSQCAACGEPAEALCEPCAGSLLELGSCCRKCAEPIATGTTCRRCSIAPLPLHCIVTPWRFGGQLASAIRRLKFAGKTHVARDLAPLWAPLVAAVVEVHDAMVVPVPLHWRRRLVRGYDHAWLLARHACAASGLPPPVPALRRTRYDPPQSTLDRAERRDNLRGAFAASPKVAGRAIALVDDVVTTGSTFAACARALYAAGATTVVGVALARATSGP